MAAIEASIGSASGVLGAGSASGASLGVAGTSGLGASAMSVIASAMSSVRISPFATITSISSAVLPLILLNKSFVLGARILTPSILPPKAAPMVAPPTTPKPSSFMVGILFLSITATEVTSPAPIAAPCAAWEPSCLVRTASFVPCFPLLRNGMVFIRPANKALPCDISSLPSIFCAATEPA